MVSRDGDVVEEDVGIRPAPDRHAVAIEREALPHAPAARPDDEDRAVLRGLVEVDRDELAGLADAVGRRGRLRRRALARRVADEGPAALAVVGPLSVGE